MKFTDEMEQALSAQRHLDKLNRPVTLVYGTLETPEFQRQSRDFAAALQAAGKPVTGRRRQGYNHFEVKETLANPYGFFGRAVLEQMRLAPGVTPIEAFKPACIQSAFPPRPRPCAAS